MARKKKHEEHVNHERWLVSYADFITLLFATFTALYAISNADMAKFKEMALSMKTAFNGKESVGPAISIDPNAKGSGDMVIQIVDTPFQKPAKSNGEGGPRRGDGDQRFDPVQQVIGRGPTSKQTPTDAQQGTETGTPSEDQQPSYTGEAAPGAGPGQATGQATEQPGATPTPTPAPGEQPATPVAAMPGLGAPSQGAEQVAPPGGETATPTPIPTPEPTPTPAGGQEALGSPEGKATDALASQISQILDQIGVSSKVQMRKEERGLVISLGEAAFFSPGGTEVMPQSVHTLDKILNALRGKDFEIRIEGHTDNTPVGPGHDYHSNEELSALRATHIMEFMMKEYGFPGKKLSVAGFGAWRPIASNDTPEGRQRNRRVDLVILNKTEAAKDPH